MEELWAHLENERLQVRIEHWQVGVQVTQEQYDEFLDQESNELYALKKGAETRVCPRSLWDLSRQTLADLEAEA